MEREHARTRTTRPARGPARRRRDGLLVVVLVVVAIGIVASILVGRGGGDSQGSASVGVATSVPAPGPLGDLSRRVPADPLALGRPDAPVVMVMFSDFRCPFCAQFSRETEQQLVDRYVEPGLVRMEWRDYPIFGEQSVSAAQAGRAAAAQGRFWEFQHAVFADAPQRGHPDLSPSVLEDFAREAGVPDMARFRSDATAPPTVAAVQSDLNEASALGVPSTPAFVINGNPIMGAQPVERFEAQIGAALGQR